MKAIFEKFNKKMTQLLTGF